MSSNNPNEQKPKPATLPSNSGNGQNDSANAAEESKQSEIPQPTVTIVSSNEYLVTVPGLPAELSEYASNALDEAANLLTLLSDEMNIREALEQRKIQLERANAILNNQLTVLKKEYNKRGQ